MNKEIPNSKKKILKKKKKVCPMLLKYNNNQHSIICNKNKHTNEIELKIQKQ